MNRVGFSLSTLPARCMRRLASVVVRPRNECVAPDYQHVHLKLGGAPPERLTETQQLFLEWNAERLQISLEESRVRFLKSWAALRNGHAGTDFRRFCDLSYSIYSVFYEDSPSEVFDSYRFHRPMHFLRMLSYPEPEIEDAVSLGRHLPPSSAITILDFGCGLAQVSRALAAQLRERGRDVRLVWADIPTARKEFLLWVAARTGLCAQFLDCTPSIPIPKLPPSHLCIVTEVFEHVHEPLSYLSAFDASIECGGLLLTNVADHQPEYMHVSPCLASVRQRLNELRYDELIALRLFRKPGE